MKRCHKPLPGLVIQTVLKPVGEIAHLIGFVEMPAAGMLWAKA
jgi:hypothetical protein